MKWYHPYQYLAARRTRNRILNLRSFLFVFTLLLCSNLSLSQDKLRIINGDLLIRNPDQPNESIFLESNKKGQVQLIQKNTTIESDSTNYFDKRNYAEALGNVFINQDDSIDIYSNEAFYYGNTEKTILTGEVALLKDFYSLQTEKLNYDLRTKVATYNTGGELADTSSTLTSKRGTFYVNDDRAVFKDSVVLVTPTQRIETDKLTYSLNDKWAFFEGPTTIYEEEQVIKTTKGKYNTETGEAILQSPSEIFRDGQVIKTDKGSFNTETGAAILEGNPEIDDDEKFAKADRFIITDESGFGKAEGNVYLKDKKNNAEIYADQVEELEEDLYFATGNVDATSWKDSINLKAQRAKINQVDETLFATDDVVFTILNQETQLLSDTLDVDQKIGKGIATGRPFLSTVDQGDSIFLISKRMEAVQNIQEQDTVYDFIADKHVMLFKSNIQAVADSAYVNQRDSMITLYKNPVLWSDSTQMSADTIRIFLKGKEIDRVEFRDNCFFINLVQDQLYNQLKGKKMDAFFVNGKVDSLHTNGNAETIFMVQDDDGAYVAIDQMQAGKMDVTFLENEVDEIYWYEQQTGTTHPFQEVNPETFILNGFEWREREKPTSKEDLLIAIGRKEGDFKFIEREEKAPPTKFTPEKGNDQPVIPLGKPDKGFRKKPSIPE